MVIPVNYTQEGLYQGFTLFEKKAKKTGDGDAEEKEKEKEKEKDNESSKNYQIVSKVLQCVRYVPLTSETKQINMHKLRMQYQQQKQQKQNKQEKQAKQEKQETHDKQDKQSGIVSSLISHLKNKK